MSAQGVLGAPLLQGYAGGDNVVFAFGSNSRGRIAVWNSSSPDQFTVSGANAAVSDIASTVDGSMFAVQSNGAAEIHHSSLFVIGMPASAQNSF